MLCFLSNIYFYINLNNYLKYIINIKYNIRRKNNYIIKIQPIFQVVEELLFPAEISKLDPQTKE